MTKKILMELQSISSHGAQTVRLKQKCEITMTALYCHLELNEFMALLDSRLAKQKHHPVTTLVATKVRREGCVSSSLPPPNAPKWAVQTSAGKKEIVQYETLSSLLLLQVKKKIFLVLMFRGEFHNVDIVRQG